MRQPKMYTRKGTFNEVVTYLEKSGTETCWIGEIYFHSVFTPFLRWLAERPETLKTLMNLKRLRENFTSDDEAIKELPILYKEFVEGFQQTVSNIAFMRDKVGFIR